MKRYASGTKEPILLLIDGECNLCHRLARFVYKRDRAGRFRFAPLQSKVGQRLLTQGGLPPTIDTIVMLQEGRYYIKSEAALQICRKLDGLWPLLYGCIVLPVNLRDRVYDAIASRRYRIFGRRDACLLPEAGLIDRFLAAEEE